jgi:hypothetical protein
LLEVTLLSKELAVASVIKAKLSLCTP